MSRVIPPAPNAGEAGEFSRRIRDLSAAVRASKKPRQKRRDTQAAKEAAKHQPPVHVPEPKPQVHVRPPQKKAKVVPAPEGRMDFGMRNIHVILLSVAVSLAVSSAICSFVAFGVVDAGESLLADALVNGWGWIK